MDIKNKKVDANFVQRVVNFQCRDFMAQEAVLVHYFVPNKNIVSVCKLKIYEGWSKSAESRSVPVVFINYTGDKLETKNNFHVIKPNQLIRFANKGPVTFII